MKKVTALLLALALCFVLFLTVKSCVSVVPCFTVAASVLPSEVFFFAVFRLLSVVCPSSVIVVRGVCLCICCTVEALAVMAAVMTNAIR